MRITLNSITKIKLSPPEGHQKSGKIVFGKNGDNIPVIGMNVGNVGYTNFYDYLDDGQMEFDPEEFKNYNVCLFMIDPSVSDSHLNIADRNGISEKLDRSGAFIIIDGMRASIGGASNNQLFKLLNGIGEYLEALWNHIELSSVEEIIDCTVSPPVSYNRRAG